MASRVYNRFATVDWESDDIRAALVLASEEFDPDHPSLDDVDLLVHASATRKTVAGLDPTASHTCRVTTVTGAVVEKVHAIMQAP